MPQSNVFTTVARDSLRSARDASLDRSRSSIARPVVTAYLRSAEPTVTQLRHRLAQQPVSASESLRTSRSARGKDRTPPPVGPMRVLYNCDGELLVGFVTSGHRGRSSGRVTLGSSAVWRRLLGVRVRGVGEAAGGRPAGRVSLARAACGVTSMHDPERQGFVSSRARRGGVTHGPSPPWPPARPVRKESLCGL